MAVKRTSRTRKPATPASTPGPSPRSSYRRWRRWLPRAVFESFLIVLSVVLALSLSEWLDGRSTVRRVEEARAFFADEIGRNQERLTSDEYLPHHERLVQAITVAETESDLSGVLFDVHAMNFEDAVWESFSGNDEIVRRLPAEELFLLAAIYRTQAELETTNRMMFEIIMSNVAGGRSDSAAQVLAVRLYLSDVLAGERALVGLYAEALRSFN